MSFASRLASILEQWAARLRAKSLPPAPALREDTSEVLVSVRPRRITRPYEFGVAVAPVMRELSSPKLKPVEMLLPPANGWTVLVEWSRMRQVFLVYLFSDAGSGNWQVMKVLALVHYYDALLPLILQALLKGYGTDQIEDDKRAELLRRLEVDFGHALIERRQQRDPNAPGRETSSLLQLATIMNSPRQDWTAAAAILGNVPADVLADMVDRAIGEIPEE